MQDLLRGITSRADLTSDNWAAHFANRLKYQWTSTHLRGSPPFTPLKRSEAFDYAALHATDRYSHGTLPPTLHPSHNTLSLPCTQDAPWQKSCRGVLSAGHQVQSHAPAFGMISHYLSWSCMRMSQAKAVKGQTAHIAGTDVSCQCLLTEVCLGQPTSAAQVLPVCAMTNTCNVPLCSCCMTLLRLASG